MCGKAFFWLKKHIRQCGVARQMPLTPPGSPNDSAGIFRHATMRRSHEKMAKSKFLCQITEICMIDRFVFGYK